MVDLTQEEKWKLLAQIDREYQQWFDYVVNNQTGKWNDLVFNLDNILKDFDLF